MSVATLSRHSRPPAAATALESSDAKGHVLGWRQLADLHDASPIVMSSACDSGAAVLHAGGERLGLERPLFAAGTIAFVAPQWPVPATSIQRVMLTILETYLAEPTRSLAAILTESRNQAIAAGLPRLRPVLLLYSAMAYKSDDFCD